MQFEAWPHESHFLMRPHEAPWLTWLPKSKHRQMCWGNCNEAKNSLPIRSKCLVQTLSIFSTTGHKWKAVGVACVFVWECNGSVLKKNILKFTSKCAAGDQEIFAEYSAKDHKASGRVDYAVLLNGFAIIILEVRKYCAFDLAASFGAISYHLYRALNPILWCRCNNIVSESESTIKRRKSLSLAYLKALCEPGEAPWDIERAWRPVVLIYACLSRTVPKAAAEEAPARCRPHDRGEQIASYTKSFFCGQIRLTGLKGLASRFLLLAFWRMAQAILFYTCHHGHQPRITCSEYMPAGLCKDIKAKTASEAVSKVLRTMVQLFCDQKRALESYWAEQAASWFAPVTTRLTDQRKYFISLKQAVQEMDNHWDELHYIDQLEMRQCITRVGAMSSDIKNLEDVYREDFLEKDRVVWQHTVLEMSDDIIYRVSVRRHAK